MKNVHPSLLRQYAIVFIVNFGSLPAGISQAWPSPAIVKLYNGTETSLSRPITDEEGSWIVSGGYLAATGTFLLGGFLINKIGRKYCIISVTLLRICVSIWTIFATEVWMLILCRAVMILTDCFMYMVVSVYVSEIASKEHRGSLGTFLHIISSFGIVIALSVGPFVSYTALNVVLATVLVVTSLPLPFLPDSPVYLHSKGHIDDAIKVLSKIRYSDEIIKQELKDYKSSLQNKAEHFTLFKNKIFLKSLLLGILICGGTNAVGFSAVSFYLQTVLDSSHTKVQPEIASVIIGCIQLFAAICSPYFTKKFGRRPILIYSIAGMFFGMIGLGTFFKTIATEGYIVNDLLNYLPIISLILCAYCFNIGLGYLFCVVSTELFDAPARATGLSICFMTNLFLAFLSSKYFAIMTLTLGPSETYWFFSAMCIIIGGLISLFLPETKVNLGSLTTGISLAWPSPIIVKLRNGTDTPLSGPITEEEGSWIVSGGYLAAMGTNLLAGMLIDKIGRKYCIILVTIPRICVSIWIIFGTEVWMLIFCRSVMILTDCYIFVVVPMYVSEIASKEHRGALGTFLHVLSCLGIVIALAVGPFVSYRTLNVALATVIIVTAIPLPFLPDSPVYLHSKGRIDEAIAVLSKFRDSDETIKQELEDYKSSKQIKIDKIALLKDKLFLKSLALGILICGGANAIGYNAVAFYLQTILESTQTNVQPEFASVIIGCIQLFAAICTSFFTKWFGRRPMLIYSVVGVFCSMIGLGTFFKISSTEGYAITGFLNYLPIISLILSTYCFNVGIGCLLLIVTVELFDGPARAFGYSLSFLSALLLAFLSSKYFAQMTLALGPSQTYWFFSVICVIVGSLIAIYVPETKGKTFSEIQIALGNKNVKTEDKDKEKQEC